jgi:hypothetical protein
MAKHRPLPVSDMWTVSTGNTKTGVIPTQYVGLTREETLRSCSGCALLPDNGGGGCYAWTGRSCRAANSVRKATMRGRPAGLVDAIERCPRSAKLVRFGAIGDPARVHHDKRMSDIDTARSYGFKIAGYTHFWKDEPRTGSLRHVFLASCETTEQIKEARDMGWLVSVAGPESFPGMVTCPNYERPEIQCNRCRLCDVTTLRRTKFAGVVFPAHGISAKRLPLANKEG